MLWLYLDCLSLSVVLTSHMIGADTQLAKVAWIFLQVSIALILPPKSSIYSILLVLLETVSDCPALLIAYHLGCNRKCNTIKRQVFVLCEVIARSNCCRGGRLIFDKISQAICAALVVARCAHCVVHSLVAHMPTGDRRFLFKLLCTTTLLAH